jgi:hypothetical protein
VTGRLGDHGSLRNWPKPEPPRLPDTASAIDRIMSAAPPQTAGNGKDTSVAPFEIHTLADVDREIASLKANGIEQLTDVKGMTPEQIVAAQREGRLLEYARTPSGYRTSSAG